MPAKDGRPLITYAAPVVPISFGLDEEPPTTIRACGECLPWSIDITQDEDGQVRITEWHAAECAFVARWLSDDDED